MTPLRMHRSVREPVAKVAYSLSSGTMATLTGYKDYATLDIIRQQFYFFCLDHPGAFDTWQDAWTAFRPTCPLPLKEDK